MNINLQDEQREIQPDELTHQCGLPRLNGRYFQVFSIRTALHLGEFSGFLSNIIFPLVSCLRAICTTS